jgi:hypothetical protein
MNDLRQRWRWRPFEVLEQSMHFEALAPEVTPEVTPEVNKNRRGSAYTI